MCWKFSGAASIGARLVTSCLDVTLYAGTLLVRQRTATQLTTSGDQWREFCRK